MTPTIQRRLLEYIDEHYLSYTTNWLHLYTQLYTLHTQKMQEGVISWLQRSGMAFRFLTSDQLLIYSELETGATQTLLFYTRLPLVSSTVTASHIATALITYQSAVDACLHCPNPLPVNIKWLFDGQSAPQQQDVSVTEYRSLLHADKCIWYTSEPDSLTTSILPTIALGTKGSLRTEIMIQTAAAPIAAQYGAIVPNAGWQLLWALTTLKDRREDILIDGFYDTLLPMEDNVIEALAHLAQQPPALVRQWGLQELLLGLQGLQQYYAYFLTPTCTVNYLQSGQVMKNHEAYIPQTANAQLDFQLVPRQDPLDIYTKLQNHLLAQQLPGLQVRLLHAVQPTYTSLADPFVHFVIQATTTAYGQSPQILPLIATGASPYLQQPTLPVVITPAPFAITEPQEFHTKGHRESLMKHIKQAIIIIAGTP
jgi:hypothetical protein